MFIFDDQIELEPKIGFWALLLMAFSGTLGGGFFTLLGIGAGIAGPLLPFSFMIAGLIAFIVSRVYAELATAMPAPGGGQVYVRNAFGERPSLFIAHWLTWLAEIAFSALNAIGLGLYLSLVLPLSPIAVSLISIGLLVLINLYGVDNIEKIELFFGFAFVLALIGVIGFILKDFSVNTIQIQVIDFKGVWGMLKAVPLIFVLFIGTEDVAAIAGEIKNKSRNIPKAFTWSILALTSTATLTSFLLIHTFPLQELANHPRPFQLLFEQLGALGGGLSLAVAITACASSLFFGSLADTRTAYALGKAGEFPKIFTKLNKHKVPFVSILVSGFLLTILTITESANFVGYVANLGFFLEVIFISFALIKLRKKRPKLPRPFLIKHYPLVPILAIGLSSFFLILIDPMALGVGILFSLIGLAVYLMKYFNKEKLIIAIKAFLIFLIILFLILLTLI